MSDTNSSWEQVARDCQESFEKADSNWKPEPPFKAPCQLVELRVNNWQDKQDPSKKILQIKPVFNILDGQYQGTQFAGDGYTNRTQQSLGFMRSFLEKMLGESTGVLVDDIKAVQGLAGNLIAEVETYRKGEYINSRVTNILETGAPA